MLAWHFMRKDRRLRFDDGRKAIKGRWLEVDDPQKVRMCNYGLHASKRIYGALGYAPGPVIARVELGRIVYEHVDKCCSDRRKIIWWIDGTKVLRRFAFKCLQDIFCTALPLELKRYMKTIRESDRVKVENTAYEYPSMMLDSVFDVTHPEAWEAARCIGLDAAEYLGDSYAEGEYKLNARLTSMVIAEARRLGVYTK